MLIMNKTFKQAYNLFKICILIEESHIKEV